MRKIITSLALSLTLGACASNTPKLTLDEKLQGKSPEMKKEILRLECLGESEWSSKVEKKKHHTHRHYNNQYLNYTQETRDLKVLCREMTTNYDLTKSK